MVFSLARTVSLQRKRKDLRPAKGWLVGAAIAGFALSAQAQSLVDFTESAQSYDATWQSKRAELDAAISRSAQAKAGLLPQVGLQASSQYSESRVRGDFPTTALHMRQDQLALQAKQPLYAPANLITYAQGTRNVDLIEAQVRATQQELLVRVAQAYFQLLTANDTLRLVQAQKRAVIEQFEFAQRNFEIGTATITDSREAQARLDLVQAQEIATENDVRVAKADLEQLTGSEIRGLWHMKQPFQNPAADLPPLATWLEEALTSNPYLQQNQIALDMAQLETEKAYAGHKPTVDLQASYANQRNPDGSANVPLSHRATSGSVGIVLNVPLFAGFSVQNRVKETLSLEEKAAADWEASRRKISQTVRSAFYGVDSAARQVQALEAAVASSQSSLEANQLGYEVGVRINMDVLNAQSQLFQSQKELSQARYQLLLGFLQLKQATGNLSMQDVHRINALLTP